MSTIHSPFKSWLITCNFSSVLIVFHWFFTWIAVGDVDICFSLILLKSQSCWRGNCISRVIVSSTQSTCDWWHDSDITFCLPSTQDRCGQGSSLPNRVKWDRPVLFWLFVQPQQWSSNNNFFCKNYQCRYCLIMWHQSRPVDAGLMDFYCTVQITLLQAESLLIFIWPI
jgi:hypothetical protein